MLRALSLRGRGVFISGVRKGGRGVKDTPSPPNMLVRWRKILNNALDCQLHTSYIVAFTFINPLPPPSSKR